MPIIDKDPVWQRNQTTGSVVLHTQRQQPLVLKRGVPIKAVPYKTDGQLWFDGVPMVCWW